MSLPNPDVSVLKVLQVRGGMSGSRKGMALASAQAARGGASSSDATGASTLASLWGAGGVVMILGKSIKRILPIALEPFGSGAVSLSTFQLG